jgi:eukaryotic-like serine/threonine-protein kinase
MTPERWKQIERLYHSALEREPGERESFLDRACAGDDELRREIASLLAHDGLVGSLIAAPALADAAQLMADASLMENTEPQLDSPTIAREVGPYKLQSLLGRGGMGEVYLALDPRLGRRVALKLLPEDLKADPEVKRRFAQEARAASALNHPNIITIYEIGSDQQRDFIAMEYVEGETLRGLLARGKIDLNRALELVAQCASGLAAAHEAGIIHRDIKPENLMVARSTHVKILDFGLAKLVEKQRPSLGMSEMTTKPGLVPGAQAGTTPGTILGTVAYMSPE